MPRNQYDILRDQLITARDKDEAAYREQACEYILYLHWKIFHHLVDEFEAIFTAKDYFVMKKNNAEELILPLFEKQPKPKAKPKKDNYVWQVANGFEIDFMQIHRLLSELILIKSLKFTLKEISKILGYAEKKAKGITRPLYFFDLLKRKQMSPTLLAKTIQSYDPYFEDIGTLWFLHYLISSKNSYIIWHAVVSILMQRPHFTIKDVPEVLKDWKKKFSEYSFDFHLKKEFVVIIKAYTNSEFCKLNIVQKDNDEKYIRTRPVAIPDDVVYAVILYFKEIYFQEEVTLEIKNLIHHENAPARLLFINENVLRQVLERLRIKGLITIESFADLDQIKFDQRHTWLEALEVYYKRKFGLE